MVAVGLLALAFSRPFVDASLVGRSVSIVLLDTSYSVADPIRFGAAQAAARAAIAEIPASHRVGVVTFDDRARVASLPSLDHDLARLAVDRAVPGFGGTRYGAAIDRAVELIGSAQGQMLVVTDLQRVGWVAARETGLPSRIGVTTVDVGLVDQNLAVASVELAPDGVVGVVVNAGADPRAASVRLLVDDDELAVQEVELPPGSSEVPFEVELPRDGVVTLEVSDPSGLAADNRRYRLLDPVTAIPVAVVGEESTRESLYVYRALSVGGVARLLDDRVIPPRELSEDTLAAAAVAVVLGAASDRRAGQRLRAFVEAGGGVLLAAGSGPRAHLVREWLGVDTEIPADIIVDGPVRRWSVTDVRHPVFRVFGGDVAALGLVRFTRTVTLGSTDGRWLATFSDGSPALVEQSVGRGRAILFASDLGNRWNDFPRLPTFVPFLHEVIRYLGGDRPSSGQLLVADAPAGVRPEPGVHTTPTTARRLVLNVDPREADITRMSEEAFRRRIVTREPEVEAGFQAVDDVRREAAQELWWYAILGDDRRSGRRGLARPHGSVTQWHRARGAR